MTNTTPTTPIMNQVPQTNMNQISRSMTNTTPTTPIMNQVPQTNMNQLSQKMNTASNMNQVFLPNNFQNNQKIPQPLNNTRKVPQSVNLSNNIKKHWGGKSDNGSLLFGIYDSKQYAMQLSYIENNIRYKGMFKMKIFSKINEILKNLGQDMLLSNNVFNILNDYSKKLTSISYSLNISYYEEEKYRYIKNIQKGIVFSNNKKTTKKGQILIANKQKLNNNTSNKLSKYLPS
jgi:hypothetical protein